MSRARTTQHQDFHAGGVAGRGCAVGPVWAREVRGWRESPSRATCDGKHRKSLSHIQLRQQNKIGVSIDPVFLLLDYCMAAGWLPGGWMKFASLIVESCRFAFGLLRSANDFDQPVFVDEFVSHRNGVRAHVGMTSNLPAPLPLPLFGTLPSTSTAAFLVPLADAVAALLGTALGCRAYGAWQNLINVFRSRPCINPWCSRTEEGERALHS